MSETVQMHRYRTFIICSPLQHTLGVISFIKYIKVPVLWTLCLVAFPARVKHLYMVSVVAIAWICWQDACHLVNGYGKHGVCIDNTQLQGTERHCAMAMHGTSEHTDSM